MDKPSLQKHAYALDVSGYTILPAQIQLSELQELREAADKALARSAALQARGVRLPYTETHQYYNAARCMYCWGDACVRALEHPAIHDLAAHVMDSYQLWDMLMMAALPAPEGVQATVTWHRDFTGMIWGAPTPGYLWRSICLDDLTAENGATWLIPGSHRRGLFPEPATSTDLKENLDPYPTRLQACAKAGDIVVFNPTLLHNSGHNRSSMPRRLLNVAFCHRSLPPLLDHWQIAGPEIRKSASPRLRALLNEQRKPLDVSWPGLPENWQTAG